MKGRQKATADGRKEREGVDSLTHSSAAFHGPTAGGADPLPLPLPPPSLPPSASGCALSLLPALPARRCTTHGGGGATYIIESVLNEEKSFCECAIPHKATKDGPREGGNDGRRVRSLSRPQSSKGTDQRSKERLLGSGVLCFATEGNRSKYLMTI